MFNPGDVLRKWRNKRGIGLVALAKISKVDKGTISKIENGGSYRQPTFEKLCAAFGKTPFDVYRELVEGAINLETNPAGFTCSNPDHTKIHAMLDDMLDDQDSSLGNLIKANIAAFHTQWSTGRSFDSEAVAGEGLSKRKNLPKPPSRPKVRVGHE